MNLQVRRSGSWSLLHTVQRTNYRGVAVWTAMRLVRNSYQFRVHLSENATTDASSSRGFYVPRC